MFVYIEWWGEVLREEEEEKEGRERGQESIPSVRELGYVGSFCFRFLLYVHLCTICTQCPQRPEDGVGFSGTEHGCWESNPDPLAKRPVLYSKAVSSPAGLHVDKACSSDACSTENLGAKVPGWLLESPLSG